MTRAGNSRCGPSLPRVEISAVQPSFSELPRTKCGETSWDSCPTAPEQRVGGGLAPGPEKRLAMGSIRCPIQYRRRVQRRRLRSRYPRSDNDEERERKNVALRF